MNNTEQVTGYMPEKPELDKKVLIEYIPHGIDEEIYKPLSLNEPGKTLKKKRKEGKEEIEFEVTEFEDMLEFKKQLFNNKDYDFIVFYNSRNIRRKMPGDVILAFSKFTEMLTKEQKEKTALLMHTHLVDENGTDLMAVKNAIAPDCNVLFSTNKLDQPVINYLYNFADITINMASNEGYGLSTAESLMAGSPIIVNVTGGLQDQCGFMDEKGKYLDPDVHFTGDWGSNHDGKYKDHGEWVKPIYPTNRALVGSPPTPYIFDDRCDWMDAANAIKYWYDKTDDERQEAGKKGRQFMFDTGMTSNSLGLRFIDYLNTSIKEYKPKKRFKIHKM